MWPEIAPGGFARNCRVLPGARCRRERMNGFKLDVRHAHSRPIVFRKWRVGKKGVEVDHGKLLNIEHFNIQRPASNAGRLERGCVADQRRAFDLATAGAWRT